MLLSFQVALVKGFFFYTTYLLSFRQFRAGVRLLFRRPWERFVEACRDPGSVQRAILRELIERNRDTEFGREHGFCRIRTADEYRRAVPVAGYDAFAPSIERIGRGEQNVLTAEPAVYFARTSGTTGRAKNIPCTARYLEDFRRAQRIWYRSFALAFPGMIKGNPLTVVSNRIECRTPAGIPCGSLSRPLTFRESELADRIVIIPREVFLVEDFNSKYYTLLRLAVDNRISTIAAVNPSTIVMFAKKLAEFGPRFVRDIRDGTLSRDVDLGPALRARIQGMLRPHPRRARELERLIDRHGELRPVDAWPMLCGLACWKGGSADFYLGQFPKYYGDRPVLEMGYIASEGHFSVPLDTQGNDGVFSVQSQFCEFIPVKERDARPDDPSPPTLTAEELEVGQRYYVVVSGAHGLYRYDMNDVVEVTGFFERTPRIRFVHKGGTVLSITGEKVTETQLVAAVSAALQREGLALDGFSATLRLSDPPRYLLAVESAVPLDAAALERLADAFDRELCRHNLEYEQKRASERLGRPVLTRLTPGAFERYRAERVHQGAPDAHVKPPHVFRTEEALRATLPLLEP
ncbi:MAG: GH3 auxin-responsive promoter family protein [Myxococcales bacterium]|nr:GH3 auxin-responsive promoter family protein [Myxococcales bacterium]